MTPMEWYTTSSCGVMSESKYTQEDKGKGNTNGNISNLPLSSCKVNQDLNRQMKFYRFNNHVSLEMIRQIEKNISAPTECRSYNS